mgnify:CR=1 FL=1
MLFNSLDFICWFLPASLILFFISAKISFNFAKLTLIASSLFFYSWWNPAYLYLIILSILTNFILANYISKSKNRLFLYVSIFINLGILGYYKYYNFFIDTINETSAFNIDTLKIILPLGISFFTFQQIAYHVDLYRNKSKKSSIIDFSLFVSFFPQLIAGPIVHNSEILPQLCNKTTFTFNSSKFISGLCLFSIGLFKKVIIADSIAIYSNCFFDSVINTNKIMFAESWFGTTAFALQIYFDFSGYSDMAIGLGLMFGILLPINFNSPYKAITIIEFWKRWHITLSRFLRDYIYIPLGGNRHGSLKKYLNLFITMILGGVWHGASWTFVLWGGIHGLYLIISHYVRSQTKRFNVKKSDYHNIILGRMSVYLMVTIAWVFFRAENFDIAQKIVQGMLGFNGIDLPRFLSLPSDVLLLNIVSENMIRFNGAFTMGIFNYQNIPILFISLIITYLFPNSNLWIEYKGEKKAISNLYHSAQFKSLNKRKCFWGGILFFISIKSLFDDTSSEFLYYNF